jgi:hypothetical protein
LANHGPRRGPFRLGPGGIWRQEVRIPRLIPH